MPEFDWGALADSLTSLFSDLPSTFGTPGADTFGQDPVGQYFIDSWTGQPVSYEQIQADPTMRTAWQTQYPGGGGTTTPEENTTQPVGGTTPSSPTNWAAILAGAGIALPTAMALGGIIQQMAGGGTTTTNTNTPNASPTAQAAQQTALNSLNAAQQYAFGNSQANAASNASGQLQPGAGGLAGQLGMLAPYQQAASLQSLLGLLQQNNPFTSGYNPQPQMQPQPYGGYPQQPPTTPPPNGGTQPPPRQTQLPPGYAPPGIPQGSQLSYNYITTGQQLWTAPTGERWIYNPATHDAQPDQAYGIDPIEGGTQPPGVTPPPASTGGSADFNEATGLYRSTGTPWPPGVTPSPNELSAWVNSQRTGDVSPGVTPPSGGGATWNPSGTPGDVGPIPLGRGGGTGYSPPGTPGNVGVLAPPQPTQPQSPLAAKLAMLGGNIPPGLLAALQAQGVFGGGGAGGGNTPTPSPAYMGGSRTFNEQTGQPYGATPPGVPPGAQLTNTFTSTGQQVWSSPTGGRWIYDPSTGVAQADTLSRTSMTPSSGYSPPGTPGNVGVLAPGSTGSGIPNPYPQHRTALPGERLTDAPMQGALKVWDPTTGSLRFVEGTGGPPESTSSPRQLDNWQRGVMELAPPYSGPSSNAGASQTPPQVPPSYTGGGGNTYGFPGTPVQAQGGGNALINQMGQQVQQYGGAQGSLLGMAGIGATQLGPSPYTQRFTQQIGNMANNPLGANPQSQAFTNQAGWMAQNPLGASGQTQGWLNQIQGMSGSPLGPNQATQNAVGQIGGLRAPQPGGQVQGALDRIGGIGNVGPSAWTQNWANTIGGMGTPQPGGQVQSALNQISGIGNVGPSAQTQGWANNINQLNAPTPGGQVQGALDRIGQIGNVGPSPYTQQYLNQVGGLPNQITPSGTINSLQNQAQGMTQGNLPSLNPQLAAQVHQVYQGPQQDINRYLDQALRDTLERSRQQGFAGGAEVLREGTPSALMAPGMAEAQRQQGILAGQEAGSLLNLAQSLPQQGGALATTAGNLGQQNLAAQQSNIGLGLTGAQNLFGQQATGNQLQQALGSLQLQGAQVPFQQALAGSQNQQGIANLGLQSGQNLFGQQATGNQLQQTLAALGLQGAQVPFQQAITGSQNQQALANLGLQSGQALFGQQATGNQLQQQLAALGLQGAQVPFQQQLAGSQNQQNLANLGLTGGQALFGQQATGNQLQQALLGLGLQGSQIPFNQQLAGLQNQQAALGLGMQGAQNVFGQQATGNQLQQALLALGLQGGQNMFGQNLQTNQNMQNAAAGYTTPLSVALGGGLNLSNLNQNIIGQLGQYGQQGTQNQLDFLRALYGGSSAASGLAGTAQAGAGSTQTQNQPFNLLNAFAPTASLLGGIGGAMTGYGAMTGMFNPATSRAPGM